MGLIILSFNRQSVFIIKRTQAEKGKMEGIITFPQISKPFIAPFIHISGAMIINSIKVNTASVAIAFFILNHPKQIYAIKYYYIFCFIF